VSSPLPGTPIDRYTLRVLISTAGGDAQGIELWQAYDPLLDRTVALRLIPANHPRAAGAAAAAREAATVEHRNLVSVLDVLDEVVIGEDMFVAVVHEWAAGKTLADLFEEREGEPLTVAASIHLAHEVALAMVAAHRAGVGHGRIRPGCLLIEGDGDVDDRITVRGLAVDTALWGPSPDPAVGLPDCHGIGSLLYAGITARWPEGLADGVSGAPRHGGHLLAPGSVVADVSAAIDEICARSIDPSVWGYTPTVRQRGRSRPVTPYGDVRALLLALGGPTESTTRTTVLLPSLPGLSSLPSLPSGGGSSDEPREAAESEGPPPSPGRRVRRIIGRTTVSVVAAAAVAGLAFAGLRVLGTAPDPWQDTAAPMSVDILTRTPDPANAGSLTDFTSGLLPGQIPVSEARVYGPDRSVHNPDTVSTAIDRNPSTGWTTDRVYNPDVGPDSGVPPIGLILDLGTARAVSAVRLELVGAGSSVSIRVGSSASAAPETWSTLAEAEAIGDSIDLRSPRPVVGRYVLVWLTRLPPADYGFIGGVRDIAVLT
jgi:serine/threonine protein kinase